MKKKRSNRKRRVFGIAKTLRAAAGRTGLPAHVIQSAKSAGCRAFAANGTVDCDELVEFVASRPEKQGDGDVPNLHVERARDIRANRMLKEQRLAERAGELVSKSELRQAWFRNTISAKTKLYNSENQIAVELAMRLGLSSDQLSIASEIVAKHQRFAIKELFVGDFGRVECPLCNKEIPAPSR